MGLTAEQESKIGAFEENGLEIAPAVTVEAEIAPEHVTGQHQFGQDTDIGQKINPADKAIDLSQRSAGVATGMQTTAMNLQGIQGLQPQPAGVGELFGATCDTVQQAGLEIGQQMDPEFAPQAPQFQQQPQAFHL